MRNEVVHKEIGLKKLPKWEKKGMGKEGTINWIKSAELKSKVNFVYNEIIGSFEIIEYDKSKQMLTVVYNNKKYKIGTSSVLECRLGELLGVIKHDYKYNIGDIISSANGNIEIIEQIKNKKDNRKGYKYKCLKCNNVDFLDERNLIYGNQGCNVCCASGQKVLKGYNDVATTHPHLIKYFVNINDAYSYSHGMSNKVLIKCPNCGINNKIILRNLCNRNFNCPSCGDGISYPNKVLFGVLRQLNNIVFKSEMTFNWSKNINNLNISLCGNKRYDFYINNYNIICEVQGKQHYEQTFGMIGGRTLEEEQENDRIKKELALDNGVKEENYIVINARKSELEFIKNNILNSRLNKIFDLSDINWNEVENFALSSRIKEVCELKRNNPLLTPKEIALITNLEKSTIRKYLNKGNKLGWCNYQGDKVCKKELICIDKCKNVYIFNSLSECKRNAEKLFGVKFIDSSISMVCQEKRNHHKGFHFKYIENLTPEEYIKYDIENKLKELKCE